MSEASSAEVVSQPQQPASSTWIIENKIIENNSTTNNLTEKPVTPVKNKNKHQNQIHHHHKHEKSSEKTREIQNVINKMESTPKKSTKLVNGNNNHKELSGKEFKKCEVYLFTRALHNIKLLPSLFASINLIFNHNSYIKSYKAIEKVYYNPSK